MERAKLRIVTDTAPPKIVAQTMPEVVAHSPINSVVAVAVPPRRVRHLNVDEVLARSLPKLTESFKKAA